MKQTLITDAIGIIVTPLPECGVAPFKLSGPVTYADFESDGRIYYCQGQSFMADIVTVVRQGEEDV